ncbi:GNAT family N-acetyltransferase [Halogranum rubrum]|uniref:Acetyltransferase, ribosomal protein n-acetylase n=1 Tax=Halogranum salarium B-1 TaxID=1210908 RepID=J3A1X0_9EURY|nr:GNAT family protein [Halogranum salarium]EJN59323.1 acetyltransferase, ribosomal protein n-acetylase [Halogranum salarium B-1]
MFPAVIETDRLRLQRFCRETIDTLDLYEYTAKSDTVEEETRYVTWDPHPTPKLTWDFLTQMEESWENAEDATYCVFPKDGEPRAGEFAGNTGLHLNWDKRKAGLGIWLRKPFWGHGYSGERAGALLQLAFDRLDLEVVDVGHLPANDQSKRAIEKYVEKYGGRHDGVLRNFHLHDDEPVDLSHYSISQAEWRDAVGDEREATFVESLDRDD